MFNTITFLDKGSALTGKVTPGDELLFVNGHSIHDVLDYKFYTYDKKLSLEFKNAGIIEIRKKEGEDLGLNFETYLMDRPTGCANRCVFCFVDQLPRGMRDTLYFKDDDARLSFLTGNYITCTNLSERELQRICDLRISPLNISVHATDPDLRARLLHNPRGGEIMSILSRFSDAGITMDCQIVTVPGWNDGEQLSRTMHDLASFYPHVSSVSIVPVGLTCHRDNLTELQPFTPEKACETIVQVESFAEQCYKELGSRIFFCSDELYIRAGRSLPSDEYYEGYPQLENGVGLLRLLKEEFTAALKADPEGTSIPFSIATGKAAEPFLRELVTIAKADGRVYGIPNDFLGHTIDVSGLLTGKDIIHHLQGKDLGNYVLIPQTMLRHGEGVFLDDLTPSDVSEALGVPVIPLEVDGGVLLDAMRGIYSDN